jgi:predicted ArsR family transcriptional regulator
MDDKELENRLASVAALEDPLRRRLYFYVVEQAEDVSRDQAAAALEISRHLAAFHLDKLVNAGLLETTFRRLTGRTGPGAGRPSKLYRRSTRPIEISLPERHYELAGQLMVRALGEDRSEGARERLRSAAREWGERLGAAARGRSSSTDRGRTLKRVMDVLRGAGFEPVRDGQGGIVLRNCPFDALARSSREVVCSMNLALIEGVIQGLHAQGIRARLEPQPGCCCVAIHPDEAA